MPTVVELDERAKAQIRQALNQAMPPGFQTDFYEKDVPNRNGACSIMVRPEEYPEAMYAFISALAKAEINLRDSGLKVLLTPDVQQRMLVIGQPQGRGKIAFLSLDGNEQKDLAAIFEVPVESLLATPIEGYAYDSKNDLDEALQEAKTDHPDADFSRVEPNH